MNYVSRKTCIGFLFSVLCLLFIDTPYAQRNPNLISSRNYVGIEVGVNNSWSRGTSYNITRYSFIWPP